MPTRSLALAMLISLVPALAHAHPCPATDHTAEDDTLTLASAQAATEEDRRLELASIDSESHAATALYVTSLSLVVTGLAIGLPVGLSGIACIGAWGPGASGCGENATKLAASISGYVLMGLSIIALPIAIGLDVDSGSRRGGWQSRAVTIDTVQLTPTEGGAYLSLGGRF